MSWIFIDGNDLRRAERAYRAVAGGHDRGAPWPEAEPDRDPTKPSAAREGYSKLAVARGL